MHSARITASAHIDLRTRVPVVLHFFFTGVRMCCFATHHVQGLCLCVPCSSILNVCLHIAQLTQESPVLLSITFHSLELVAIKPIFRYCNIVAE